VFFCAHLLQRVQCSFISRKLCFSQTRVNFNSATCLTKKHICTPRQHHLMTSRNPLQTQHVNPYNSRTIINIDQSSNSFNQGLGSFQQDSEESGDTKLSIGNSSPPTTVTPPALPQKTRLVRLFELSQVCAGIYASFFVLGFFQEKITRRPYGENQDHFNYPLFLVCLQCLCNAATAFGSRCFIHIDITM
jgi:hypothetical protein